MVGYGQMTEVLLWVQTTKPAAVQYRYWNDADPAKKFLSETVRTDAPTAFIAKNVIAGLTPGTKYSYELLLEGKTVKRPYPLRFQTQPLWQWRTDPPAFTVGFGSCAFVNQLDVDRPGRVYGGDYGIFTAIAAKQPDLFLWIGDNTYLREVDWDSRSGIIWRHTHTRSLPEMQPLLGAAHNIATWDDHDFGPNDADRSYRLRKESLEIFKLFWGNQTYGTAETDGVFGRFIWGDVEFFLLDDRYHRSPNRAPDDAAKTMFGPTQLQWLKDALINSSSNAQVSFRIIVNGNQMLNMNGEYYEALPQFSTEYNELMTFLRRRKIPGILFLTGDRHHSELIVVKDSSLYPLYDFTSSPLTSGINTMKDRNGNPSPEFTNPMRVPGTLVNDARSFGMLSFGGTRRERTVTLECYDAAGARRWSRMITAEELRVP